MRARRSRIKNTALHTIAHVSAISMTIRNVAVRWRRRVEMICSMGDSLRLELDGGGDLTAAPGRQDAGEQARHDRDREREREHRHVEVREIGVRRRLVAHGEQAEPRESEGTADEADRADSISSWTKIARLLAPSARRTPISPDRRRNFVSNSPTVL